MKMNITLISRAAFHISAGALALAFLAACGGSSESDDVYSAEESADSASSESSVAKAFIESEPEGAQSVLEVRKNAKPGDPVVVSGKIAGAMSPFTDGFANFVLADTTLETCDMIPDDECPTPWDACCVEGQKIKASRLSVQLVGEDGRPLAAGLEGVNGLSELDELVVTGTVAESSTEDNLIVSADGIFLRKHWKPESEE